MKKAEGKKQKSILHDDEISKILKEAEDQKPEQISFFKDFEREKIEINAPDVQNPALAYKLYYSFIQRFLYKYLPKGDEFKKARKIIRKEINLFLKEGKLKGRDGRQAYTHMMMEASNTILAWYYDTSGKDLFNLYKRFNELNSNKSNK